MYQHEIAMMSEENSGRFPLLAITNLDHVKTLHLAKGEVVGFARPDVIRGNIHCNNQRVKRRVSNRL